MSLGDTTEFRVAVLGEPSVRLDNGERQQLRTVNARLVVSLALVGAGGQSKTWLEDAVWNQDERDARHSNFLAKAVSRAKRYVPVESRAQGGYRIGVPEDDIDAWVFRRGVAELTDESPPTRLDRLLGMWQGDPRDNNFEIRDGIWRPFNEARTKLVSRVLALPEDERARLTNWGRFCELFHRDSFTWDRGHAPRPRRKRVLVVDDKIGDSLALVLDASYDCTVVHSFVEAVEWLRAGDVDSIDCAVVDRHLTDSMVDAQGEVIVLQLLRTRPALPVVLMSAALAEADMDDEKARLGVARIIHKSNLENGAKTMIYQTVSRLIGT